MNNIEKVYTKYPIIFDCIHYVNEYNPGRFNPYHNNMHMYQVFEMCIEIVENSNIEVNEEALYIAALFHDFNHAGIMGNDHINIEKALAGFKLFAILKDLNINLINDVNNIIISTQYPSILDQNKLTIEQQIISDADMCAQFRNDVMVSVYNGLMKEFNIGIITFFNNQKKFVESLTFKTDYCRTKWALIKNNKLSELENLAKCYQVYI